MLSQIVEEKLSLSLLSYLSAIDVSARTTMKGAANCDKHCELQSSVSRQILEYMLCFRVSLSADLLQCRCIIPRMVVYSTMHDHGSACVLGPVNA